MKPRAHRNHTLITPRLAFIALALACCVLPQAIHAQTNVTFGAGLASPSERQPSSHEPWPVGANLRAWLDADMGADALGSRRDVVIHMRPGASLSMLDGVTVVHHQGDRIEGSVTRAGLCALADETDVLLVTVPIEPLTFAVSEGVALSGASDWQLAGYDGTGVKIGIVDKGFEGYLPLLSNELPPSPTVQSFRGDGDIEAGDPHGTACAEVVFEMAPQADFYYVNVGSNSEFRQAVEWLTTQGVDVILSGLGWPISGPGDGTGEIAQIVINAINGGAVWVNAAGNMGQRHWQDAWQDDGNGYLNFTALDETNELQVDAGETCRVGMRWEDSWSTPSESFSLQVYNQSMGLEGETTSAATGPGDPTRYLQLTGLAAGRYHIAVQRLDGTGVPQIELFTFDQDLIEHVTPAGSLAVPADVPGALAVGAVAWDAPTIVESFSSRGPSQGAALKPDLVAFNQVSGYTYGNYASGVNVAFQGTSAAAAHVAGAAALIRQMYPSQPASGITALVRLYTSDLGTAGPDNDSGYGVLDLGPAATLTPDAIPTLPLFPTETATPTVTPTASATPTVSPTPTQSPTITETPAETYTPTRTPTESATPSQTPTITETPSETYTPSVTPTQTRTSTPGPTSTRTLTPTETPWPSVTPTWQVCRLPLVLKVPTSWITPSPTATNTPTRTATPTLTATATQTPLPSATSLPGNCTELVRNGGFESAWSWSYGLSPRQATRVTSPVYDGARALQAGILPGEDNVESHSSVSQNLTIPWNATSVTLQLAWWRGTEEPTGLSDEVRLTSAGPKAVGPSAYLEDMQEILLLDQYSKMPLDMTERCRENDGGWTIVTYDISHMANSYVKLYLNVYNDGAGGRTWAYLDDVSIIACTP